MHPQSQKPPRALALVGMPGAGKTTCAKFLEQRGYFQYRFGSVVEDEVKRRGWTVNPQNEKTVREEFRHNEGMEAIAHRALPHLKAALRKNTSIVIDGLYGFGEYKLLKREFKGDLIVLAVVSPRWMRYQRLANREDRPLTTAEAEMRDYAEIENLEKGGPIAIADFTLLNDGETSTLLARLDELVDALGMKP